MIDQLHLSTDFDFIFLVVILVGVIRVLFGVVCEYRVDCVRHTDSRLHESELDYGEISLVVLLAQVEVVFDARVAVHVNVAVLTRVGKTLRCPTLSAQRGGLNGEIAR